MSLEHRFRRTLQSGGGIERFFNNTGLFKMKSNSQGVDLSIIGPKGRFGVSQVIVNCARPVKTANATDAAIESKSDKLPKKLDTVKNSQNPKPNFTRLGSHSTRTARTARIASHLQRRGKTHESGSTWSAMVQPPATPRTNCEPQRRPMYTFRRGNESSDDESDTDTENCQKLIHFCLF